MKNHHNDISIFGLLFVVLCMMMPICQAWVVIQGQSSIGIQRTSLTSSNSSGGGSSRSNSVVRMKKEIDDEYENSVEGGRRPLLKSLLKGATTAALTTTLASSSSFMIPTAAVAATAAAVDPQKNTNNVPPSFVQEYSDFTESSYGWRYRDVKAGSSTSTTTAEKGDRVVFDWSGYTIGYFGRPFQAKGGPVGGAFETKDLDYLRTVIGSGTMIPALEQALSCDMKPGGVRQVIVPFVTALTYPADDPTHERVGPKPTTFSGMRALNFVLDNPRLDRTLLFNVKLIRIDKANGKGGFVRGDKGL